MDGCELGWSGRFAARGRRLGRPRCRRRARVLGEVPFGAHADPVPRTRYQQGRGRRPGEGRLRAERRRRRERSPLRRRRTLDRDRGVLHDELPGAGGQGAARGDRDQPRVDHDAPRPHEHADDRGRAAQGSSPGARGRHVADPDHDRLGDGDRADLPGAAGPTRRTRGARAAAERVADRLRLRARSRDHRRGGQRPLPRRCRGADSPASSATRSGRSSASTT